MVGCENWGHNMPPKSHPSSFKILLSFSFWVRFLSLFKYWICILSTQHTKTWAPPLFFFLIFVAFVVWQYVAVLANIKRENSWATIFRFKFIRFFFKMILTQAIMCFGKLFRWCILEIYCSKHFGNKGNSWLWIFSLKPPLLKKLLTFD